MRIVVLAALALVQVDVCLGDGPKAYCQALGNVYTPYPGTDCRSFDHRRGTGPVPSRTLMISHNCPPGTKFDVRICVCNWEKLVTCEASQTPSFCEQNGNVYTPIPGTRCTSFDHRAGEGPVPDPKPTHQCPSMTQFDTTRCTCDYPSNVVCATP